MAEKKAAEKKTPAEKAAEATAAKKPAAKKPAAKKAAEPVLKTIVQANGKEIDVSTMAADLLKSYKSTHKRKNVTEFVVYVKPEEGAAYYTVNGEGQENFKQEL